MISPRRPLLFVAFFLCTFSGSASYAAGQVDSVTSNGVKWTFASPVQSGVFVNGDPWVIGPVELTGISNSLNSAEYTPKPGQNGSMINPGTDNRQGYDSGLRSYDESLNFGLLDGKPIAPDNTRSVAPGSSVVSMVSWLWNSKEDAERGTPRFNGGTKAPRPVTRSGAILTVLAQAPPADSFRPPYAGDDKTLKFTSNDLRKDKLLGLVATPGAPDAAQLAKALRGPWIDHVHEFLGAMIHPSENMPNYGRDMGQLVTEAALLLHTAGGDAAAKEALLHSLVQYGIDCAGIADNGGGWPANGGHGLGRKLPILFAGVLLGDAHLLGVGSWDTRFQENENTFFVSDAEVAMCKTPRWKPDKRAQIAPYEPSHVGMPEWGIRHSTDPYRDNFSWDATYRDINNAIYVGIALVVRLMGQDEAWGHPAFLAYADRVMHHSQQTHDSSVNSVSPFVVEFWNANTPAATTELKPEWL